MTRALAILILLLAAAPAEAQGSCRDGSYPQTVRAKACDRVSHRCVWAWRRFCPTWR